MQKLYPILEPYASGFIDVSELHSMYYEECGNKNGKPIVFLHGGPGGGIIPKIRQFFDPEFYRIILFDQRGCGKSTPHAELTDNTTWHLVSDIETLREHLGIEQWAVFGGSWGSTLALTYAISHPNRVKALILRGIFLCRPHEIDWFYQKGASYVYPDYWEDYVRVIPASEQDDMVSAYYKRLTSPIPEIRLEAAKAWSKWEAATSKLLYSEENVQEFDNPEMALAFARIECHYFINKIFFDNPDFILENIREIRHIPTVIVQGRYDMVCPMTTAWDLHKAFPEAKLVVVPDAGHSAMEDGIATELISATNVYKSVWN
jgi:proline iminopeptidase